MTFEQLIAIVREWQSTMTPEQARTATEELAGRTTIDLGNLIVGTLDANALWGFAAGGKPAEQADPVAFLRRLEPRRCASARQNARPTRLPMRTTRADAVPPPDAASEPSSDNPKATFVP